MNNWKTTTAGVLTIVVGLITFVLVPLLNGQPINIGAFTATLGPGIAGILASDAKPAAK